MDPETFQLFERSNFDAHQQGLYAPVLREGLGKHGLSIDDVLVVHQDMDLWVLCRTGLFRGSLVGWVKKRSEIGAFIGLDRIASLEIEASGPHSLRLVVTDRQGTSVARIDFSPAGPGRDVATEQGRCRQVYDTMLRAWEQGTPAEDATGECPCGTGPANLAHLDVHLESVTTQSGIAALTYDCPVCGRGSELWRDDAEGRGGATAGLAVHLATAHAIAV